jgi:hypothetical protein
MDKNREHLKNLTEIRSMMEKASTFISLSGLSGISAGIIGLAASVYVYFKLELSLSSAQRSGYNAPPLSSELISQLIIAAFITLILTFAAVIFFTTRKARKKGLPVWSSPAKLLVLNLFIPLAAGGIFCLLLIYHSYYSLIAPSMILFYGLALVNASKYTFNELKFLGISEILLGLLSMFWFEYAIHFWAIGFGLFNIIYGIIMYHRHER